MNDSIPSASYKFMKMRKVTKDYLASGQYCLEIWYHQIRYITNKDAWAALIPSSHPPKIRWYSYLINIISEIKDVPNGQL